MNRVGALLAGALVVVLLGGAAALWFAQTYDWVPVTHRTPAQPSVAADPWTAFVRGWEPRGVVARYETVEDIDWDEAGLLVARWSDLESDDPDDWIGWVQGGGRLIVVVEPSDAWSGPWVEMDLFASLQQVLAPETAEEADLLVGAGADSPQVTVAPSPWWTGGYADVTFETPGETGAALLVWNLGEGWLMLSGPLKALHNEGLAEEGNRRFAEALVAGLEPGQVWIPEVVPETKKPAATNPAGPFWFGLAVLIGLLLWSQAPRLGPVLSSGQEPRLGLSERLVAEGRFLWARRQGREMVARLPGAELPPGPLSRKRFVHAVTRWVQSNARPPRNSHDD